MICCSIVADTVETAIHDMLRVSSKADMVEIRLDYVSDLSSGDIEEIISKKRKPVIMTCRMKSENGMFSGSEDERIDILKKCIRFGADYIDIESNSGKGAVVDLVNNKKDSKIIISYHNFDSMPDNLDEIYDRIKNTGCDIVKIACMANLLEDNLKIFELIKKAKSENIKIIGLCMGEKGEISRVLNVAYGSYLTYGCLEKGKEAAPGQISCEFLKRIYRVDKLKLEGLNIYGLIGNPVSESRGFIVHNLVFRENEMNAVYLNFLVDDLGEFISSFKDIISGLSITMPYKQEIIQYLSGIDDIAKKVGAVNTVVVKDRELMGYNTDVEGAIQAIKEKGEIKDKNIVMIGAGGAARAIGYGVISRGGKLIIVNRTAKKGRLLAKELSSEYSEANEIKWDEVDILINATSIGMMPKTNESPIDRGHLKNMLVFDTVYNPLITKMIDMADKNGCTVISGIKMFIYQAAKQFELWTSLEADIEFMEQKILEYVVG